tara:strand:- start:220 stop:435 length:216 start_codon:yes stop_codon:yes gene_type:complete
MLPSVFEVGFNFLFKILINWLLSIVLLHSSKELGKVISIVKWFMEAFELIQDSYEVTHYVREYGNTENEDL